MLDVLGAVAPPEGSPDAGVAWHYGDPLREQRTLDAGSGFVDRSHRPVIRVAGPERLTWLHSVTSQHLTELAPGVATEALVLSPNGHVEHHLALTDDGEQVLAHVEPGTAAALLDYLNRMKFWAEVDIADVTADWAVMWRPGPAGADGHDRDVFVPRSGVPAWTAEAGPPAGTWAFEALRVAARRPRLGFETDHRTIPHEVGWIGTAVHLDKGCYRGQETVARVQNLGRPPRRLVLLHLDGSAGELPASHDEVRWQGRGVGFVGTVVQHRELGPVALALVKRQVPEADALQVAVGDGVVPATQD